MKPTQALYTSAMALLMLCGATSAARAEAQPAAIDTVQTEEIDGATYIRPVRSTLSLQLGQGQTRDTYLTPLLYEGASLSLRYDRWRRLRSGRLTAQQTVSSSWLMGTDPGEHSDTWAVRMGYRYALHFGVLRHERLSVLVGPYAGMELGFNYNLKLASANNPATLSDNITLAGLSVATALHYRLGSYPCQALLTLQAPLAGVSATTDYGASYYETFYLEDYEGDFARFTTPANRQDLDIRLTTDIPLAVIPFLRSLQTRLNVGVQYTINTMKINHLVRRFSTAEFVIGWTYEHIPYYPNRRDQLSRTPINPW